MSDNDKLWVAIDFVLVAYAVWSEWRFRRLLKKERRP